MFLDNMKCDYCFQIYFDAAVDAAMDGKDWIECSDCQKWNHTECEIAQGKDKQMRDVAVDQMNQQENEVDESIVDEDDEGALYWCLKCRKVKAAAETKKLKAEQQKKNLKIKKQDSSTQERVSTRQIARASRRK